MPVRARSAPTTSAATTGADQARATSHHQPPSASPMAAPTAGNQDSDAGVGAAAPPSGVRNERARRAPPIM